MATHRTHRTGLVCFTLIALLLLRGADAQRGRIQFTGRLVTPAAPFIDTGAHALADGNAANTRQQPLSTALAAGDPPELLVYFAGYARPDAPLIVTTYE